MAAAAAREIAGSLKRRQVQARSAVSELLGSDIGQPDWIAMAALTFAALLTLSFAAAPLVRRVLA